MKNERHTIQRDLVLQAVRACDGHCTAEELYLSISPEHPHISRATIYRNLNLLVKSGILSRVSVPNAPERYEVKSPAHYHFQCLRCGDVADVDMPYLPELAQQIRNTKGCLVQSHSIVFHGICPKCLKETGEEIK